MGSQCSAGAAEFSIKFEPIKTKVERRCKVKGKYIGVSTLLVLSGSLSVKMQILYRMHIFTKVQLPGCVGPVLQLCRLVVDESGLVLSTWNCMTAAETQPR